MSSRPLARFLLFGALGIALAPCPTRADDIRFAGMRLGTSWYVFSATLYKLMADEMPEGTRLEVMAKGGGIANPLLVEMGKADVALANRATAVWARDGHPLVYEGKKHGDLRVLIGGLNAVPVSAMVREGYVKRTGHDTLEKIFSGTEPVRVVMKPKGSSVPVVADLILAALGTSREAIRRNGGSIIQVSAKQIPDVLRNGQADVYFESMPKGHPTVTQVSLTVQDWLDVLVKGVQQAATVAIPIAAIGLIIEVAIQSSLVLKFSVSLIELGGGTMIGAMLWIIIGCLIMGMGLPTVAAYIIGAILFVPALLDFGLPKLGAHFFVMYYCVLSMVTPPIALASYTAAGLAQAPVMKTCFAALRLSAPAFVIPFAFIFSPALLAQGSFGAIAGQSALLLAGTAVWAVVAEGFVFGRLLSLPQRLWLGMVALFVLTLPAGVHGLGQLLDWGTGTAWLGGLLAGLLALGAGAAWCLKNERINES